MWAVLKGVFAITITGLAVLFGIGFLLSILFEIQGFGERDSTPSGWRLIEYGVGVAACVVVPFVVWAKLLPHRRAQ